MSKEATWEEFLDYVENTLGIQLCEYQKIVMKEIFERGKEEKVLIPFR